MPLRELCAATQQRDGDGRDTPAEPGKVQAEGGVQRDRPGSREGETQTGSAEHEIVLEPAARREEAVLHVYARRGDEHDGTHQGGGERRQEAQGQQQAAAQLSQACGDRLPPPRREPQLLHEACRAVQAVPVEPAKQLLGAVRGERQTGHKSQKQKPDIHGAPQM